MSKQNFIAGKGFSVEDNDGVVTSFIEVASGHNIELKNLTTLNQNHTFLGDLSQKNDYILVARTTFNQATQTFTLGDYTQTLGVYPQLPNNSLNIIKSSIVATNASDSSYRLSLNYDLSVLCTNNTITQISDIETSFAEDFPTGFIWSVVPYIQNRFLSFTATGNPGTANQQVLWMCYLQIISSTFLT